tara:strand:+ start:428 stop:736 length:309 start_codon:yes stop_codon:yes gene_type:complete
MLTATLSVSKQNLRCKDIVETLARMGVACSVTANTSLVKYDGTLVREPGCRIVFGDIQSKDELRRVWDGLQQAHRFTCGHAVLQGAASGCVFDVFGASRCPG